MHFSETYHAFNPILRALLEKRAAFHLQGQRPADQGIAHTKGVGYLRAAKAKAAAKAQAAGPDAASAAGAADPA